MEPQILYSQMERDGLAWGEITLNRPEKGNALNIPMVERLAAIVGEIEAQPELRAVVIRGRGRFFSTGGDIAAWGALSPLEIAQRWILPGIEVFARIAALRSR